MHSEPKTANRGLVSCSTFYNQEENTMKKWIAIILTVLMIVSSVPLATASAATGDSASSAVSIGLGKTYTASWTKAHADAQNYYSKFTVSKRGYVTIKLQKVHSPSGISNYLNTDIYVYTSSGKQVWQAYSEAQDSTFSDYYTYKVGLNKGTYYLNFALKSWALSRDDSASAKYSVSFKATDYFEVEPNNSTDTATAIQVGKKYSAVYCDESYDTSYMDFFKVNLKKGHTYKFKIGAYGELSGTTTLLYILNSSLNELGRPDDSGIFRLKAGYTGTYYIKLYNCGFKEGVGYSVAVSDTTPYLTPAKASLYVGEKTQLHFVNAKGKTTWKTSNKKIATVSSSGKVTAKKAGKVTISVVSNGMIYKCKLTVKKLVVKSVKLSKKSLALYAGKSAALKATINPSDIKNAKVKWKSSDTKVATVSSSGKITAKKAGKATITATFKNKKAACKVTVKKFAITGLKLSKTAVTLAEGTSAALKTTITPKELKNTKVTWKSSNTKVATVNASGKITAKKAGKATITAVCKNKKAACKVTVKAITVKLSQKSIKMKKGASCTLKATVTPAEFSKQTVTWKSSDAKTAAVNSSGKVTAKKEGTAVITAVCGNKKATCKVIVQTNFERFRDYIIKNGKTGDDGNPTLTFEEKDYTLSVAYQAGTQKFRFYCDRDTSGRSKGEMYMSLTGDKSMPLTFYFASKDYEGNESLIVKGTATIIPSDYTWSTNKYKPEIRYTYDAYTFTRAQGADAAINQTTLCMLYWNDLLENYGFSFEDFGFTNWRNIV